MGWTQVIPKSAYDLFVVTTPNTNELDAGLKRPGDQSMV